MGAADVAESKAAPAGLENDIQSALAPLREQIASLTNLEFRLTDQLDHRTSECSKGVELRLETNIARSQQRVEQQIETKLSDVRSELANLVGGVQVTKEALESARKDLDDCKEERDRIANFMESSNLDSMWESFAQLAGRLSEIECNVEDFLF